MFQQAALHSSPESDTISICVSFLERNHIYIIYIYVVKERNNRGVCYRVRGIRIGRKGEEECLTRHITLRGTVVSRSMWGGCRNVHRLFRLNRIWIDLRVANNRHFKQHFNVRCQYSKSTVTFTCTTGFQCCQWILTETIRWRH